MYNEVSVVPFTLYVCVWVCGCNPNMLSLRPFPVPLDNLLGHQYLDRIGQLFFGVPPKQSPSYGGLLGELTVV